MRICTTNAMSLKGNTRREASTRNPSMRSFVPFLWAILAQVSNGCPLVIQYLSSINVAAIHMAPNAALAMPLPFLDFKGDVRETKEE
ncbi:hypothetical protein AALP_AA2G131600 [Arabis alpina]|uniref:Uncharacterized protein n=1 Tax=Arabis alpina TaxID=50452 RepID=A0A087HH44_ARAAL|nr:hypothetical protein AALP_AA2G131600 [Arabis alpina]